MGTEGVIGFIIVGIVVTPIIVSFRLRERRIKKYIKEFISQNINDYAILITPAPMLILKELGLYMVKDCEQVNDKNIKYVTDENYLHPNLVYAIPEGSYKILAIFTVSYTRSLGFAHTPQITNTIELKKGNVYHYGIKEFAPMKLSRKDKYIPLSEEKITFKVFKSKETYTITLTQVKEN